MNTVGVYLYSLGILYSLMAIVFLMVNRILGGEVKLCISSSRNKYLEIILLVIWTALGILAFVTANTLIDYLEGSFWTVLAILNLFVINSGLEIRQKGIFYFGELIPWAVVERVEWNSSPNANKLRIIRKKSLFAFSKEINITIPSEKVTDVMALVNQNLQR